MKHALVAEAALSLVDLLIIEMLKHTLTSYKIYVEEKSSLHNSKLNSLKSAYINAATAEAHQALYCGRRAAGLALRAHRMCNA